MASPSIPTYWQQAWDQASPRLQQWMNSPSQSLAIASERVNRVGQLDAEALDGELTHLLQEPVNKALALLNPTLQSNLEPELLLLIRIILHKFSLWNTGASYGAKLQDLHYVVPKQSGTWLSRSGLPVKTLLGHAFLTILTPYIHTRIKTRALSHGWPDAPSSDYRRKLWKTLNTAESLHSLLGLLNFVVFLSNGRYRTLSDRLLSMRLAPTRQLSNRAVSYEFMNRQMVWHAFTEFILLVLPLLSSRVFRRSYKQARSWIQNISLLPQGVSSGSEEKKPQRGPFYLLSVDQCAICADGAKFNLNAGTTELFNQPQPIAHDEASNDGPPKHPITIPYRASCGDVYCYTCISECLARSVDDGDSGWTCLRCGGLVKECARVSPLSDGGSDYSLSELEDDALFQSDVTLDST